MKKGIITTIMALTLCGSLATGYVMPVKVQAKTNNATAAKQNSKSISFVVPAVYTDTTKIKGKSVPYSWVQAKIGEKLYKAATDKNGAYTITIPKQPYNTKISFCTWKSGYKSAYASKSVIKRYSKNLTSNALTIETYYIRGTTVPNATVEARTWKETFRVQADKAGNYEIWLPRQKVGKNSVYLCAFSPVYNIQGYYIPVTYSEYAEKIITEYSEHFPKVQEMIKSSKYMPKDNIKLEKPAPDIEGYDLKCIKSVKKGNAKEGECTEVGFSIQYSINGPDKYKLYAALKVAPKNVSKYSVFENNAFGDMIKTIYGKDVDLSKGYYHGNNDDPNDVEGYLDGYYLKLHYDTDEQKLYFTISRNVMDTV